MDNFTFYAPTYFDFGKGAEKHVADLIKKTAFKITRAGQLVAFEASKRLCIKGKRFGIL